jgi:DNA repair exonuclease SbcCD ATPase subunit
MLKVNRKTEQDRKPMFEVSEIEQDITENSEKLTTNNQLLDTLNHNRYIQSQMETILSDDGIKSHFLNKLLPILNDKINYYLDKFEMSVIFSFDNLLNESIRPIGSREDVSYMSCSEGEKKRIDISILLSFIDIIKSISTWDCNLLFIDELFDSAVDGDNLGLILNSLKEHTLQNKKLCVYLISHRAYENGGLLDKVVEIKKEGSFSRIVKGS